MFLTNHILDYTLINVNRKVDFSLTQFADKADFGQENYRERRANVLLENISKLCKEKGISISKLERSTDISNGTIGRWGVSSPTVENVRKVAEFFGVTVDSLIYGVRGEG